MSHESNTRDNHCICIKKFGERLTLLLFSPRNVSFFTITGYYSLLKAEDFGKHQLNVKMNEIS